jgi:hypothetical protein
LKHVPHYKSYRHFRRLGTAENKAFAAENKLFSAVPNCQKKLTENKAIFSAAIGQPPKQAIFGGHQPAAENNN